MPDYSRDTNIGYPKQDTQNVSVTATIIENEAERTAESLDEVVEKLGEIHELQEANVGQDADKVSEVLKGIGQSVSAESSKLLAAAGDYAAEDVLSESTAVGTPFIFAVNGKSGVIEKAAVFCSVTALTPRISLYLFSKLPTSNLVDNAANTGPSAGDFPSYEGQIDFPALEDLGGGSTSVVTPSTYGNLPLPFKADEKRLYGIAVTRDAITGEAAGMALRFKLQVRKD